ncbi:MAG: hypothetical protein QNK35_09350 [Bacteroides sp.]|nr:hypothetical protein [Bacteroides sp.]
MQLTRSLILYFLLSSVMLTAQSSILDRPDLLALADSCLRYSYNYDFEKARQYQQELEELTPDHPVSPFLEAMILYWENFPMTPDDVQSELFIDLLDQSMDLAEEMQDSEQTRLEGVFFNLFSRAFKAMFWADNGKTAKVIPDLGPMYKSTKEGFTLMDQFSEFYFSTGLYNYYVEAYPEAHPGYKALVAFMRKGDRELGLEQLDLAIKHTTFVKVQSLLFMSLIQLNYENDLEAASFYAEELYSSYPLNPYFQGLLVIIYLHLNQFDQLDEIIDLTTKQEDQYSELVRLTARAYMSEKNGDEGGAETKYLSCINLADSLGPFSDTFKAVGYMGLSRLQVEKGMHKEAKKYARKAADSTPYNFILHE